MNTLYILLGIMAFIAVIGGIVPILFSKNYEPYFEDFFPDQECERPYVALQKCEHLETEDVIKVIFTCEKITTICSNCGEFLSERIDC